MPAQGYFLTEGDKDAINTVLRLLREHGSEILSQPQHHQPESQDLTGTTQCYIARTPQGGISALVRAGDDEIRLRARDSVNIFHNKSDIPGRALCDIYRIIRSGEPLAYRLVPLPLVAQWVYNLTANAVAENEWITIVREKAGSWMFTGSLGGESGFFAFVYTFDCAAGRFAIYEAEPVGDGQWGFRANGLYSENAYHISRNRFLSGGPLIEDATVAWIRRGYAGPPQEYVIDCPAGWTGQRQYVFANVCCSGGPFNGQLRQVIYYEDVWNGQTTKQPCHNPSIPICESCPQLPNPCA